MKRGHFLIIAIAIVFFSGCSKCADCKLDPGHGAAIQEETFCGADEVTAHESLGWTCK